MSASYATHVVVGVLASEVVKVEARTKAVTKYDPDTGAKIEKTVTEYVPVIFGRDRHGIEPSPEEWKTRGVIGCLDTFHTGNGSRRDSGRPIPNPFANYDYDQHVIGLELGDGDDEPPGVIDIAADKLLSLFNKVRDELAALGLRLEPRLLVVSYVGY